ncbi:hypothetical protein SmJEL517_g02214 [Synchytrium microbalum]|uniref:Enoyl-CoA hydratase n=1 Tax=Synchytrium microbalum TaxID=1806994 RepID=A0A507C7Z6_9FUNG|nr:uncharacterized protein SmJEL517_g02214 [Synchytrium microbalum]TPX35269.1 hypothetical protein SmJEL517_g02214 [Synchytrium microbalum]
MTRTRFYPRDVPNTCSIVNAGRKPIASTNPYIKFKSKYKMVAEAEVVSGPQAYANLETLRCTLQDTILHVELNRPTKLNAMNSVFWVEYKKVFDIAAQDPEVRVIIVSSNARIFTAGLDISGGIGVGSKVEVDAGRRGISMYHSLLKTQAAFTAQATCQKASIAVVHGACIGGGVDLISAADIRYCSKDAYFCIKEVDVALAADVGTLQRLPKIVGNDSWVREMCLTARNASSAEAMSVGLISKVCDTKEAALAAAFETAKLIASKSPVAIVSTKQVLNYSRDHTVEEGLQYVATWNAFALQTADLAKAGIASLQKKQVTFSKL